MEAVATAVATKALEELFVRIIPVMYNKISSVLSIDGEIKFLRRILPKVKELVLNARAQFVDAEESKLEWEDYVKGLEQFTYDAEDILDEYETKAAQRRLKHQQRRQNNLVVRPLLRFPFSSFHHNHNRPQLFPRVKIAHKIRVLYRELKKVKDAQQRIEEFVKEAMRGLEDKGDGGAAVNTGSGREVTKAMLKKDFQMAGRDREKEWVIKEALLSPPSKLLVIVITGMGGLGKTTFAQDILRDPKMDEHFQFKMWVCVGDREHDVKRVMGKILQKTGDIKAEDLQSAVKNKRFLIVLDDAWKGKIRDWDALWTPLSYGDAGSRVIITTRDEDVVKELGDVPSKMLRLSLLRDEDCLEILHRYAFPNGFPSTSRGSSSSLESITREVVEKKVKGLPLAARLIGSSLRDETKESRWRRALQDIEETGKEHIMSVMKWSYLTLPNHLKQCFSCLSFFPKDYGMYKRGVISVWMANGYVVQRKGGDIGGQTLEEIAENYLDVLVKVSLIQRGGVDANDDYCIMHDLIHDFATEVSAGVYFFKLEGEIESFSEPQAMHHVYLGDHVELPENYSHIKKLRTFMTWNPSHVKILGDQLRTVRILRLRGDHDDVDVRTLFKTLKASFTKMMHLRHLSLIGLSIDALPQSLCNLYNLQVLILPKEKVRLPDGMWKLVQLRHLSAGDYISGITRIGGLTSLQNIGGRFCLFKNNGKCIRELGNLRQLRGKLLVSGLRHVQETRWARDAQLENKVHLEELVLDTEDEDEDTHAAIENNTLEIEVFNSLQPHRYLKKLEIKNYHGHELPTWTRGYYLLNIVSLVLYNCNSLEKLPPLGHLPNLEYLRIKNANKIDRIDKEFYGTDRDLVEVFPSLKELYLEDMNVWEEWEELIVSGDKSQKKYFPSLQRLVVERCKKLGRLPHIPPSLEELEIDTVGLTVLPEVWGCCSSNDEGEESTHDCVGLQSLKELRIKDCPCIDLAISSYDKLEHLGVSRLYDLESLQIQNAVLLKQLTIHDCRNLQQIYLSNLPSLKQMFIENCDKINVFKGLQDLTEMNFYGRWTSEVRAANEYALQNLQYLGTDSWEFLQIVDPHSLVELYLMSWNFDLDMSDYKRKWMMSWFQKLSSIREICIRNAKGSSWPPYIPLWDLHSLEMLQLYSGKDLKALPELPPSLKDKGQCIADCPLLQRDGNAT